MGVVKNVSHDKFPKQGSLVKADIEVCFNFNTDYTFKAVCVRDDTEQPFETLFQLEDGRVIRATECQYTFKETE